MKLTNNTLLCVATILVAICLVVMHYQNKTIQDFKNLIEQTDTTVTIIQNILMTNHICQNEQKLDNICI